MATKSEWTPEMRAEAQILEMKIKNKALSEKEIMQLSEGSGMILLMEERIPKDERRKFAFHVRRNLRLNMMLELLDILSTGVEEGGGNAVSMNMLLLLQSIEKNGPRQTQEHNDMAKSLIERYLPGTKAEEI